MELILPIQRTQMLANFENEGPDHAPVVKWFCPWNSGTWLLSEIKPADEDILFGLCDLGFGFPELGYVSHEEIEEIIGPGGLKIERDIHFKPLASLSVYTMAAKQAGGIVTDPASLMRAYQFLAEDAKREGKKLRSRLLNEKNGEAISFPLFNGLSAIS
ncbi:DUF2958 domain-containing protein [Pelagibius sp. Alg239-R121]|uniref:DUF2958 domain-containing protein n=1 Tax=Pelagibius sp. Alg239-R121 TaxID=2993448 RepID=UPI0024A71EA7|nr:DUF2958 domain-containing protein [Pelagibius sp. Alg239-R121]